MTDKGSLELVEKVARAIDDALPESDRFTLAPSQIRRAAEAAIAATPLVKLREALEACEAAFEELERLGNEQHPMMLKIIRAGLGRVSQNELCQKHGTPFISPGICPFCSEDDAALSNNLDHEV